MKRCLTLGLAFGLLCGGQSVTIRLYNLARVPKGTLERASTVAEQLLAGAGVMVIREQGCPDSLEGKLTDMSGVSSWSRLGPDAREYLPDAREYLVVRLVSGIPSQVYAGATGYALPFARQGAHATVFYDRVEKLWLSSGAGPGIGSIVGAAMAHEIGHVLLGSTEHSSQGIMKARWGAEEFRLLAFDRLQFTPENNEVIARKRFARPEPSFSGPHQSTASETAIESRRYSAGR